MSGIGASIANLTFSPPAGTYTGTQNVTLASSTAGVFIKYTIDGSDPSFINGTLYTGPIGVSSTRTVKAKAFKSGLTDSPVAAASYTIIVSNVDYAIQSPVFPTNGIASGAINGSFTVQNIGSQNGAQTITWTLTGSWSEIPIATGTLSPLNSSATSGTVNFSGNWPATPGVYSLTLNITASDEPGGEGNIASSGNVPVSTPDYIITIPTASYNVGSGNIEGSFQIQNQSTYNGAADVTYTVGVNDSTIIASGTLAGGLTGGSSSSIINFSTSQASGVHSISISISASDDGDATNNSWTSGIINVL